MALALAHLGGTEIPGPPFLDGNLRGFKLLKVLHYTDMAAFVLDALV